MEKFLFCVVCRYERQFEKLISVEHCAAFSAEEAIDLILVEKRKKYFEYYIKLQGLHEKAQASKKEGNLLEEEACQAEIRALGEAPAIPKRGDEWEASPVTDVPGYDVLIREKPALVRDVHLGVPAGILEG